MPKPGNTNLQWLAELRAKTQDIVGAVPPESRPQRRASIPMQAFRTRTTMPFWPTATASSLEHHVEPVEGSLVEKRPRSRLAVLARAFFGQEGDESFFAGQ
jgi:hypothetical protein